MFKNFFVLNRHVAEVNKLLAGFTLVNVFTQEKNKLILSVKNDTQEYFIEVNADSLLPYFIVKEKFNRAKKNTLDFYESYLPSKLSSIKIAKFGSRYSVQLRISIYLLLHSWQGNKLISC